MKLTYKINIVKLDKKLFNCTVNIGDGTTVWVSVHNTRYKCIRTAKSIIKTFKWFDEVEA